jgi:hypothetical protein
VIVIELVTSFPVDVVFEVVLAAGRGRETTP